MSLNYTGELGSNPFSGAGSFGGGTFNAGTMPNIFTTPAPTYPIYTPAPTFPTYAPAYPTYTPAPKTGTSLKLANIFDQSIPILSQLIASRGKYQTQQITGSPSVSALQPAPGSYNAASVSSSGNQLTPEQTAAILQANGQQPGGVGSQALNTAGGFINGIADSFGVSTTTLGIIAAVATFLYLRDPKKR